MATYEDVKDYVQQVFPKTIKGDYEKKIEDWANLIYNLQGMNDGLQHGGTGDEPFFKNTVKFLKNLFKSSSKVVPLKVSSPEARTRIAWPGDIEEEPKTHITDLPANVIMNIFEMIDPDDLMNILNVPNREFRKLVIRGAIDATFEVAPLHNKEYLMFLKYERFFLHIIGGHLSSIGDSLENGTWATSQEYGTASSTHTFSMILSNKFRLNITSRGYHDPGDQLFYIINFNIDYKNNNNNWETINTEVTYSNIESFHSLKRRITLYDTRDSEYLKRKEGADRGAPSNMNLIEIVRTLSSNIGGEKEVFDKNITEIVIKYRKSDDRLVKADKNFQELTKAMLKDILGQEISKDLLEEISEEYNKPATEQAANDPAPPTQTPPTPVQLMYYKPDEVESLGTSFVEYISTLQTDAFIKEALRKYIVWWFNNRRPLLIKRGGYTHSLTSKAVLKRIIKWFSEYNNNLSNIRALTTRLQGLNLEPIHTASYMSGEVYLTYSVHTFYFRTTENGNVMFGFVKYTIDDQEENNIIFPNLEADGQNPWA